MAKPRELKRRIRSVQNTKKITKTMELVSTSKLKRAQDRVVGARPYAQALAEVIGQLYSPELAERFPLLRQPGHTVRGAGVRRAALLLITSNRGLCGAFNANLIREARRRLEELEAQDAHTELHLVGKKGVSYFKFTKREPASQRVDIGDRPTLEHAAELAKPLMERFSKGELDAVDSRPEDALALDSAVVCLLEAIEVDVEEEAARRLEVSHFFAQIDAIGA